MKVVINKCYGGFSLSKKAYDYLGIEWDGYGYKYQDDRTNPKLIECVEKLGGKKASGKLASLEIVEIPDNIEWYIDEYDGIEHIAEKHNTWG